jgi:hypothetical protein
MGWRDLTNSATSLYYLMTFVKITANLDNVTSAWVDGRAEKLVSLFKSITYVA